MGVRMEAPLFHCQRLGFSLKSGVKVIDELLNSVLMGTGVAEWEDGTSPPH